MKSGGSRLRAGREETSFSDLHYAAMHLAGAAASMLVFGLGDPAFKHDTSCGTSQSGRTSL